MSSLERAAQRCTLEGFRLDEVRQEPLFTYLTRHVHAVGRRCRSARRGDSHGVPELLAAIGDVAHPTWRASAVGVYRLWRDAGFAVGALLAGAVADLVGLTAAVWTVAAITAASGVVVAVRMYETHPRSEEEADDVDTERRTERVLGARG